MNPISALELLPIEIWQHIDTFINTNILYRIIDLPKGELYDIRAYKCAEDINGIKKPNLDLILTRCPYTELYHINIDVLRSVYKYGAPLSQYKNKTTLIHGAIVKHDIRSMILNNNYNDLKHYRISRLLSDIQYHDIKLSVLRQLLRNQEITMDTYEEALLRI